MDFFNAVQGVLSIIFILGIGVFLSRKGWFNGPEQKLLSKLVVNVSLPLYMISNLMTTYDKSRLVDLSRGLFIPFLTMGICFLLSIPVSAVLRIGKGRKGTFRSMFALSNTIFVGLPVNLALFGETSIPFVLLYYIANTTMFWTVGVDSISRDGDNTGKKGLTPANVRRVFSLPLLGFLLAVALILLEAKLPKSVMDTCRYLGSMTTPLSLLFIGVAIRSVKPEEIRLDAGMAATLLGRFLISPLVVFIVLAVAGRFYEIPPLMKKVFIIQAAMPAMTQTAIIAQSYNADYRYAAVVTTVTTIISLFTIPLYMLLLQVL